MAPKFSATEDEILINCVRDFRSLYDTQHRDHKDQQIRNNCWEVVSNEVKRNVEDCKKRWKAIRDNYLKIKKTLKTSTGQPATNKSIKWSLFQLLTFLDRVAMERSSVNTIPDFETDTDETEAFANTVDEEIIEESESVSSPVNKTNETTTGVNRSESEDQSYITTPSTRGCDSRSSTPVITPKPNRKRKNDNMASLLEHMQKRDEQRQKNLSELLKKKEEDDEVDVFMRSIAMTVKNLPRELIGKAKIQILGIVTELSQSASVSTSVSTQLQNQMNDYNNSDSYSFFQL